MDNDKQTVLRLPAPLGATVWQIRRNPAYHPGVEDAERFLFGQAVTPRYVVSPVTFRFPMLEAWGKTVFTAEAEGEEALAHGRTV